MMIQLMFVCLVQVIFNMEILHYLANNLQNVWLVQKDNSQYSQYKNNSANQIVQTVKYIKKEIQLNNV